MTPFSCRDATALLIDYLEHELLPPRRAEFEAHLARCDACVVYTRHYEQTVDLAKAAFASDNLP